MKEGDIMPPKPLEKLPVYVSAVSAIIVLVACIIIGAALHWMAAWVSMTIVLFFVIGHFVRLFLLSKVFPQMEMELPDYEDIVFGGEEPDEQDEFNEQNEQDEEVSENEEGDEDELEGELDADSEPVEDAFLDS